MTWFNLIKRNRPRKKRLRPPVDIMGGERLKPNERVKSIEEEGHAPRGSSRSIGRGIDIPLNRTTEGKKLISEKKTRSGTQQAKPDEVQFGRIKGNVAKPKYRVTHKMPKNKCARCSKKLSLQHRFKITHEDGSTHTGMNFCRECAEDIARGK